MIVIGIDPGGSGAIAVVMSDGNKNSIHFVEDMPESWDTLHCLIAENRNYHLWEVTAYIEDAPLVVKKTIKKKDGSKERKNLNPETVSKQNRSLGIIMGLCISLSIEPTLINSTKWQSPVAQQTP